MINLSTPEAVLEWVTTMSFRIGSIAHPDIKTAEFIARCVSICLQQEALENAGRDDVVPLLGTDPWFDRIMQMKTT